MTNKIPKISVFLFSLCAVFSLQAQTQPEAFIHYDFNNADTLTTTALNKGIGGTAMNGTLLNSSGSATALQNVAGVSGKAGDYAFNNSAATMGGTGGGVATLNVRNAVTQSLGGTKFKSLTLSMWYKATDGALDQAARLAAITGQANAVDLRNYAGGLAQPSMSLDGKFFTPAADSAFGVVNSWVYIAVAIDLTQSTNNTKLYVGSIDSEVVLVSTGTISLAELNIANNLYLANYTSALDRAFEGYMDDFRLYLSTTNSAALSLQQLELVRQAAIPEPRQSAMFGLAACVIGVLAMKRYRNRR